MTIQISRHPTFGLLIISTTGIKWQLLVTLVVVCSIAGRIEHMYMELFTIYIPTLTIWLLKYVTYFYSNRLSTFFYSFYGKSFLLFLDLKHLHTQTHEVVPAFNPVIWKIEIGRLLLVQDWFGLHIKFQDRRGTWRPESKKHKTTTTTKY